ncbi:MAG: hypothetical protein Q3966_09790 [Neisseria sp.]|nr:hypothetical protein [Neisseria sp.]
MTAYRELVQRTLAAHHADMELGLSRARENEAFIHQVAARLDAARLSYRVGMDRRFNVSFSMDSDVRQAVFAALSPYYELFDAPQCLFVSLPRDPAVQCRVVYDGTEADYGL